MKVGKDKNRRGLSQNSEYPATISLKVKLSTTAINKKDPFVKVH
jgi:hypothetical protein